MKVENKVEVNMEKENKKKELTPKQKELILTIVVLLVCVVVGFFAGKFLFEALH